VRQFCRFDEHNGNAIAHRILSAAVGADQALAYQFHLRLAERAGENLEEFLVYHNGFLTLYWGNVTIARKNCQRPATLNNPQSQAVEMRRGEMLKAIEHRTLPDKVKNEKAKCKIANQNSKITPVVRSSRLRLSISGHLDFDFCSVIFIFFYLLFALPTARGASNSISNTRVSKNCFLLTDSAKVSKERA
jgi:hypothetical protein